MPKFLRVSVLNYSESVYVKASGYENSYVSRDSLVVEKVFRKELEVEIRNKTSTLLLSKSNYNDILR